MIFWIDAQLPPKLAQWLRLDHGLDAFAVRDLGLRDAEDAEIFAAARAIGAVLISKDADFVALVEKLGVPPELLRVTCGNVSNRRLRRQKILPRNCSQLSEITCSGEIGFTLRGAGNGGLLYL